MNVLARVSPAQRTAQAPLIIRRIDAIPVALPLKAPMSMAGITITNADNVLVRIEAADGTVGWGEAASAPTMTGDTLGGLVAAVRDHLGPDARRPGRARTGRRCGRRCTGRCSATAARIPPSRWRCST